MSEFTDEQVLSELMDGTNAQKQQAIDTRSKVNVENYDDIEIVSDEEFAKQKEETKNTIPYERFQQVNEQKNEFKARAEEADRLAKENEELKRKMIEFQNSVLSKQQQPNQEEVLAKLNNPNLTPEQLLATQDQRYMTKAEMQQFLQIMQPVYRNDKLRNSGVDPQEFNKLAETHKVLNQMNEDDAIKLAKELMGRRTNPREEQAKQASIGSNGTTTIGGKKVMTESDFRKLFEQTYGQG